MIALKSIWPLIKESVSQWSEDYAPSMGAALAYYTIFSIAPLLVIAIAVAGFFFGADAARGEIFAQLRGMLGDDGAAAIQGLVASASETGKGTVAAVVGVITLLLGATTVFGELQSDLDRIWDAPKPEKAGLWGLIHGRMLSFGMILGIGFLLLVSLVVSAALSALSHFWDSWFEDWEFVLQAINFVVGFGIVTGLFAMIYKLLPRCHIAWKDVWVGAAVTSLLFSVGKLLIGLYLGKSSVTSGFGAAGSLVIVLLWVYYSAQIFLLGAEFTKTYAYSHGTRREHEKPKAKAGHPRKSAQGADKAEDGVGSRDDAALNDGTAAGGKDSAAPRTPPKGVVPMNAGHPLAGKPPLSRPALARFRIAAGVAATIGLLAGEIANEIRLRRMARGGRRG
jgi:membrane protein